MINFLIIIFYRNVWNNILEIKALIFSTHTRFVDTRVDIKENAGIIVCLYYKNKK